MFRKQRGRITLTCIISSDLRQEFSHPKKAIFKHFADVDILIAASDFVTYSKKSCKTTIKAALYLANSFYYWKLSKTEKGYIAAH